MGMIVYAREVQRKLKKYELQIFRRLQNFSKFIVICCQILQIRTLQINPPNNMSKKPNKKAKGNKPGTQDDGLHDFIQKDQDYQAYQDQPQPTDPQPKDSNRRLTDFSTTFRPQKHKIDDTKKKLLESLFDQAVNEKKPDQDQESVDEQLEMMLQMEKQKKQKEAEKQTQDEFELRRKAELERLAKMEEEEEEMEGKQGVVVQQVKTQVPPIKPVAVPTPQPKPLAAAANPAKKIFETAEKQQQAEGTPQLVAEKPKITSVQNLPDMVNFFLTEIYPIDENLFLFGVLENGERMSIQLHSIDKNLYFILKTDQLNEAKQQIDRRLKSCGITQFKGEFLKSKYVFEIEGIPKGDVMLYKVEYPFSLKAKEQPRPDWQGQNYKYVVGTTYTPLELFIIKNKIKGPKWVSIEKRLLENNSNSDRVVWSGICPNLYVPHAVNVVDNTENLKVPELRVLSFSLKFIKPSELSKKKLFLNIKDPKQNVIFSICTHYCKSYDIQSKPKKPIMQSTVYYLSSLGKYTNNKATRKIACIQQDQLLSRFLADLTILDPDFLVCHDSSSVLDALITRLEKHKNNQVGKLGRLIKGRVLPRNMMQKIHMVLSGRLLVDTFAHSKDMMRSVDYSLPNMSKTIPGARQLQTCQRDQLKKQLQQGRVGRILDLILDESQATFLLMNHLQIIQLTKQLTNICGNVWRRSLDNARAERNEFLIMHECEAENLLIPDKFSKFQQNDEDDDNQPAAVKKKKKYMGGMVLDPKKGLHSQYILLLDFNSLYPSIIREFNVCFSKIPRPTTPLSYYYKAAGKKEQKKDKDKDSKDKDKTKEQEEDEDNKIVQGLPKPQCTEDKWGFLPQLIDKIVKRRTQFKKMMKNAPIDKVLVFDIIQKAYKLVSNSIYGCLGFSSSRFYAPHLAAFITKKGRDALGRAKQIVEKAGVDVIYGDTDSLMLKPIENQQLSEVAKIQQLQKLARKLKKDINQQYTKLQIDIDGVFKPLLLIMKKKYVAMKLQNFDQVLAKKVPPRFEIEYKGVDLVKRDGCEVSRRVSKGALAILMENKGSVETAAQEINKYVEQLEKYLETVQPKKDYKDFLLAKTLNKLPSEYKHGADRMPHLKVAKDRINAGEKPEALVNHAINYIITQSTNNVSVAERAFDQKKFLSTQDSPNPLKIDIYYYKAHEIFPPLYRLFISIQQIDTNYISNILKIQEKDRKHIERQNDNGRDEDDQVIIVDRGDVTKHLNACFMSFQCPGKNCSKTYEFVKEGVFQTHCTNEQCSYSKPLTFLAMISNIIQCYLFDKAQQFYKSPYKCSQCNKKWTMARNCCGKTPIRIGSTSEMHGVIYRLMRVLNNSQKKQSSQQYNPLRGMLNRTLQQSTFESIDMAFTRMMVI